MNVAVVLEEEGKGTDILGLLDIVEVSAQSPGTGHSTGVRALPY